MSIAWRVCLSQSRAARVGDVTHRCVSAATRDRGNNSELPGALQAGGAVTRAVSIHVDVPVVECQLKGRLCLPVFLRPGQGMYVGDAAKRNARFHFELVIVVYYVGLS